MTGQFRALSYPVPPFLAAREAAIECLLWFQRSKAGRRMTPDECRTVQILEEIARPRLPDGFELPPETASADNIRGMFSRA